MLQTNSSKLRVLLLTPLVFALGCEADTSDDLNPGDQLFGATAQNSPIEEVVAGSFVLSNFEALLVASRVSGEMQSPPYTVFAPWDYAFKELPYWTKMTRDRSWYGHLRDLLLGHMHEGNLPIGELKDNMTVTMINGDVAKIAIANNRPRVDGARVIANVAASDGYVYMLDRVREPAWTKRTVLDVINSDDRFSVLAQILNRPSMSAKREALKSTTAGLTFFAPTDEALAGFKIEQCAEPECSAVLSQLVENHIVGAVLSRIFTPTQRFVTQSGSGLNWNSGTGSVTCTNADQTRQETGLDGVDEELATNGIVHPIDALMCTVVDRCATKCATEQHCGAIDDGCGGSVHCGVCKDGQSCVNHTCVDEAPSYQCDIVCTGGKVLSDSCQASMPTPGESACEQRKRVCCVGALASCPSLCGAGTTFDDKAYLHAHGMSCGAYVAKLTPTDPRCVNPLPHVPEVCCKYGFPPSPPVASTPCYDLCGDDLQMVGSRVLDDYFMTCFDYARSISADEPQCTTPDPAVVNRCCDSPRPIPGGNVGNYCCLCGGCYGPNQERQNLTIGPNNETCVDLDYHMTGKLKKSDAECGAKKEAFSATCCDASFDPPPPVPGTAAQSLNPCTRPGASATLCSGGSYPKCNLCKDGSYPENPYTITAIAYVPGNPSCADLHWMGLYGHLPAAMCYPIQNFMEAPCGCK